MKLAVQGPVPFQELGQQSEQTLYAGKRGFSVPSAEVLCLAAQE